jgi:hypothetical protein
MDAERLTRYIVFFALELSLAGVEITGIAAQPDGFWMIQMDRRLNRDLMRYIGRRVGWTAYRRPNAVHEASAACCYANARFRFSIASSISAPFL